MINIKNQFTEDGSQVTVLPFLVKICFGSQPRQMIPSNALEMMPPFCPPNRTDSFFHIENNGQFLYHSPISRQSVTITVKGVNPSLLER